MRTPGEARTSRPAEAEPITAGADAPGGDDGAGSVALDTGSLDRDPGSYRDPAGHVFVRDGVILRRIEPSFADDWEALHASGLAERLVGEGMLVAHEEVDPALGGAPRAHRVIRPEPIDVITYPYEWSFSQLKDAALLTLRAETLAAEAGMTLRDASAYNVQFRGSAPVLIDSLSFERAEPGRPWLPYRQFCEHFLAPLALMARVDIRLGRLLREHLDGIPLDLAARLLPGRSRLSLGLGPHIHVHARAQRAHASDGADARAASDGRAARLSPGRRANLLESLRTTVEGLAWEPSGTAWADYADHTSYDDAATAAKVAAVRAMLEAAGGARAWDLGANTGRYSRLAAELGYAVVALDLDPAAVERAYLGLRADGRTDILPLLGDLTDPSPALGWAGAERRALLERADADVVLALALVHHLAIGANVPLPMIVDVLARIGRDAIVEFVPREDAMVQRLLASRRDVFDAYDLEAFRTAAATRFDILSEQPITGSRRTILHLRRH